LLLTGCLNMNDVYHSIEWKAIFLIAGMWPLSDAIRSTGLASGIMNGLLGWLGPLSGLGIAAILLFFALIFTQLMSGQVAALVLAPLAMAAAQGAGLDPRSLGIAVALGCSLSFPTPFGHPVNIMVMSPGGYKIKDFFRVGFPLTLLIMGAILIGLHFLWGL
jgi:di/tricarboxylate transporter